MELDSPDSGGMRTPPSFGKLIWGHHLYLLLFFIFLWNSTNSKKNEKTSLISAKLQFTRKWGLKKKTKCKSIREKKIHLLARVETENWILRGRRNNRRSGRMYWALNGWVLRWIYNGFKLDWIKVLGLTVKGWTVVVKVLG